jgi:hypothetical protein
MEVQLFFESEKSGAWSIFSKFGSEETGSLDFCLIIYYKRVYRKAILILVFRTHRKKTE